MEKTLHLILKKKWFDMILSSEKKEEYRDITPHYISRIAAPEFKKYFPEFFKTWDGSTTNKLYEDFDTVTFTNGYAKNSPRFEIECKGIYIGTGLDMWGAETGKDYFVIKLEKIIKTQNI